MTDKELFLGLGERLKQTHTKAEMHEWVESLYSKQKNTSQVQKIFSPSENVVISLYPQFKQDYQILIDNGYMQKNGDYLQWLKSKQCLAEYFGDLHKENREQGKISWKGIEKLFNVKRLTSLYSRNGNIFKITSKDYEKLQTILKSTRL